MPTELSPGTTPPNAAPAPAGAALEPLQPLEPFDPTTLQLLCAALSGLAANPALVRMQQHAGLAGGAPRVDVLLMSPGEMAEMAIAYASHLRHAGAAWRAVELARAAANAATKTEA